MRFASLVAACTAAWMLFATPAIAAPATTHPRLWLTTQDLPRLRQWAVPSNAVYQQGLRSLATTAAQRMDQGVIPGNDNGGTTWSAINTEEYAALFALMALVDPDPAARANWAQRGRTLLLHVVGRVDNCMRANPPTDAAAFCDVAFSTSDRSRWTGAAFALATDWLQGADAVGGQPVLSVADRALLRRVFLMWSYLNLEAYPNPYNNPPEFSLPVGTTGPALLRLDQDLRRHRLRFSGNNYFAGHMRNMGMMALSIDAADDVHDPLAPATYLRINGNGDVVQAPFDDSSGRLRGYVLNNVLAGWLLVQDYVLRHDSRGGLPLEGLEYAPTSIGIPAQFLYALETAGYGDLAAQTQWGAHVAGLSTNPFYRAVLDGFVHSQSPQPSVSGFGLVYRPAWYGDGEHYYQNDPIDILGPVALHAMRTGDAAAVDLVRWVQRHVPPDGNGGFPSRTRASGSSGDVLSSLLYFLVYDPAAASSAANAPDPRPQLSTSFWSEGMGRLLSRTDWSSTARWFNFRLSWNSVDHQHGDGGLFEFYRNGAWLTKSVLGYGNEGGATDYKNMITVGNVVWPGIGDNPLSRRLQRGAQMPQNRTQGDPTMLARSETAHYSYLSGDATTLYNAHYDAFDPTPAAQRALDVAHVSRSIVWLKPDHVVVYDRARSSSAGKTKRFWLNLPDRLPAVPAIAGNVTTSTVGGQYLFVSSVLPAAKTLSIVSNDPGISPQLDNDWSLGDEDPFVQERTINPGTPDEYEEAYATRLRVEASGAPTDARFLHVLQGADSTAARDVAQEFASTALSGCATPAAAFDGVAFGSRAVAFARDVAPLRDCLQYSVASAVTEHLITDLTPYAGFAVAREIVGAQQRISVTPGGLWQADGGGVLRYVVGATPAASGVIALDAQALDFAVVPVGATRELTLSLTNRGTASLGQFAFTVSGSNRFSTNGACLAAGLSLAVGQSCALTLRFAPDAAGYRGATLSIASNASAAAPVVALHGVGEDSDRIFRSGFEGAQP